MSVVTDFDKAIAKAAALLALKMGVLHVLTVRERFLAGDLATGRAGVWKEDTDAAKPVFATLKAIFVAYGPSLANVSRMCGCVDNANQNEPYFIMTCLALARTGLSPLWAPQLVYTFVAGRFAHAAIYLYGNVPQPARAVSYTVGLASMLGIAVYAIQAI